MSALTKNERDGLDEVFLSIHTNRSKYQQIRHLSAFIIASHDTPNISYLFKRARYGLKRSKFSYFLASLGKKKKNLSK